MEQKYTSKETSISTINAIYRKGIFKGFFKEGDTILDYGGGKYDKNVEFLKQQGILCLVYDPFNRSKEHNTAVINYFRNRQGADVIVCANVLCVIEENDIIYDILYKIHDIIKKQIGSKIYIQIYEGNKSGIGTVTSKGYQRNQKAVYYTDFINQVFGEIANIKRIGNIFEIILR